MVPFKTEEFLNYYFLLVSYVVPLPNFMLKAIVNMISPPPPQILHGVNHIHVISKLSLKFHFIPFPRDGFLKVKNNRKYYTAINVIRQDFREGNFK